MKMVKQYQKSAVSTPDLIQKIRETAALRQGRRNPRQDRFTKSELEQLILWMQKMKEIVQAVKSSGGGVDEEN